MCCLFVLAVFVACVAANPQLDSVVAIGINPFAEGLQTQVAIRVYDVGICTGTIVDEESILITAECMQNSGNDPTIYSVVAGTSSQSDGRVTKDVSEIHVHPEYDESTGKNNVAVVTLSSPFHFSKSIQPIALASSVPPPGSTVSVIGLGSTILSGVISYVLQAINVNIISNAECGKVLSTEIDSSMLCAVGGGKGSCDRGSGGSLIVGGKLVGIFSRGYGCAQPNLPDVYVNVPTLKPWIEKTLGKQKNRISSLLNVNVFG